MRLDRFLSECGKASRTETKKAIRERAVSVNGVVAADASANINEFSDRIVYRGAEVIYKQFIYIMLNKPEGYISATDDPRKKTVLDLIPAELAKRGLFPCGRLDIDTTGLLILTNNGQLAHRLLSPKHHVEKTYAFTCSPPIGNSEKEKLEAGVDIGEKSLTKPAVLSLDAGGESGDITITEGKFHEIKRMFFSVGSSVVSLRRTVFAGIPLDSRLSKGEWRYLSDNEEKLIESF